MIFGKYKQFKVLILLALIVSVNSSAESNIVFAPMIGVSTNELDMSTNQFGGDSLTYQSIKVGLVTQVERWTLKMSNERPLSDPTIEFNPIFGKSDLSINNIDINLAYSFDNNVSVFGGYLNNAFDFGNEVTFTQFGGSGEYSTSYSELGFYGGIGYSFPFGDGAFSTSVAYASLDSSYTDNFYEIGLPGLITEGDTTGFSYSFAWQSNITESLAYSIGLYARRFDYDSNFIAGLSEFPGLGTITDSSFDSEWNISSAALSFIYIF
jgi:hypothetical protein